MNGQPDPHWHAIPSRELFQSLIADDSGLTTAAAQERRLRYGPNRLPEQPGATLWQIVVRQFINPLIYILVAAAVVSMFIGDYKDAGFIGAVLLINALIGAYQEWKAEQSSHALKKMLEIRATVQRDGEITEVAAESLVPGDVVWLESGNRVPADLRLLSSHGLEIDESLLTGESLPVTKDDGSEVQVDAPVGDRTNMGFAGSIVTRGRAKGIVVATGTSTMVGQLALDVMGAVGGQPPLLQRMERFTKVVAIATLVACTVIGVLAVTLGQYEVSDIFLFAVALAVSAIPEGLPVAMTVALAIATTRMAKRGVIVRRLTAVEGLGSCTLVATDKTGTLTVNELTVREVRLPGNHGRSSQPDASLITVSGEGFRPHGEAYRGTQVVKYNELAELDALALAGVLCNESDLHQRDREWQWHGDAVDIALLSFAHKLGLTRATALEHGEMVNEIPFESEHQYAASFYRFHDGVRVFVKGAPERVLAMCNFDGAASAQASSAQASSAQASSVQAASYEAMALDMAARGYRVLALAQGDGTAGADRGHAPSEPNQLQFLGFVGMIDPLRAGVREAVQACRAAGVDVSMITGDHRVTALAIARDLGLAEHEHQTITGPELLHKTDAELEQITRDVRVFARVAPKQKLQIVNAARRAGHFVAVTGDGVNDAPALRAANIGVSMGKAGTDVAREASELVISDDNFATIVGGIEEGRIAYDNIRKVIYLLLSTGAAELLMVLLTVLAGLQLPLLAVHLLWLNLVTNGIQGVAIAFEPGEGDTLQRKPRSPAERIFNRLMVERMILAVLVMGGVGFATFAWLIQQGWSEAAARNVLLLLMVLFENFHIGNCRSETKSAFGLSPLRSPILLLGAIAAFLIHVFAMYVPFMRDVLGTQQVSPTTWIVVIALAVSIVPVLELHKWSWAWRYKDGNGTAA